MGEKGLNIVDVQEVYNRVIPAIENAYGQCMKQ